MPEIGSTWVTVAPSTKNFGKELDRQVGGETEKTGSDLGARFGKAFVAGSAIVGAAVMTGVGMIGKAGVAFNAEMQNFEAGFTSLLGSADAAKGMLSDLSSFAASTPFEMPTLANSATMLSQFGVAADDIIPSLQMLGDISMGDSEKLDRLSRVFGQVSSAGRLTLEDVNQMIDAGFNPLSQIAATTGESMQELRDRVSAGGVSFEELEAAMATATAEGGQFYNAMSNASQTLAGQWSTLQDGANILAGSLTGTLTDALTSDLLPGLNAFTTALHGVVTGAEGAEAALVSAGQGLIEGIGGLGAGLESFLGNVSTMLDGITPIASDAIQSLVEGLVAGLPQLAASATPLIMQLINGLIASLPAVVTAGMQILTAILQGMAAAAPQIMATIAQVIPQIITAIIVALPLLLQAGLQLITGLAQGILAAMPTLIAMLPAIIQGMVAFFMGAAPMIIMAGVQLLTALVGALPTIIAAIVAALPQIITAVVTAIVTAVPMLIQAGITLLVALIGALPQIISTIVAALPLIITGIISALIQAIPQIIQAGVQLLIALIKNLPQIISTIVAALPQIINGIVSAFRDAGPKMMQAGVDLLLGLGTGIANAAGRVIESAIAVAGDILDGIKGFFGIHSPSRVMREIGEFLDEGLAQGIDRGAGGVLASVGSLSGKVRGAFEGMSTGVDIQARAASTAAALRTPRGVDLGGDVTDGAAQRPAGDTYVLNGLTTRETATQLAEEIDKRKRRKVALTGSLRLAGVS